MSKKVFSYTQPFQTECGDVLPNLEIAFHTYGTLNQNRDNVVWVCHALTANSDCMDWWNSLIGEGKTFDQAKHFIVCANILGSCYGTSGPLTSDDQTGRPYFGHFPRITIRDMVRAHQLLREYLGIHRIRFLIGGSMGGYQCLEWAVQEPELMDNLLLLATSAQESAWGIAIHTAQRLAIEADPTWRDSSPDAGAKGLKAARAIGMLTYRNYQTFVRTQTDEGHKTDDFKASSYIYHQGEKLVKRFNAYSYWLLTKAMDSHHLGRGRGRVEEVLKSIKAKTLCIGISSDILCPSVEQQFIAKHIPGAVFREIDSPYGHDGFLIEGERIGEVAKEVLENGTKSA